MSKKISGIMDQLTSDLLKNNVISSQQAKTLVPPESLKDMISVLVREGKIDPDEVASSICRVRSRSKTLFAAEIDETDISAKGHSILSSPESSPWIIHRGVLYLSNPWDEKGTHEALNSRNLTSKYTDVGILSLSVITSPLWGHDSKSIDRDEGIDDASHAQSVMKFAEIMALGVEKGASDIHLQPSSKGEISIRMRIDKIMIPISRYALEIHEPLLRYMFNDIARSNFSPTIPQDARFDYHNPKTGLSTSVRVNTVPQKRGPTKNPRCVMRLFDSNSSLASLDALNLNPRIHKEIKKVSTQPQGLILVTGPTGSGKSTTLFAVMKELYNEFPELNIMTLENPVEQEDEAFSQIEVDEQVSFSDALRALLRQDPDVILIGEIRDKETASIAINAALTGHLVLSTLHTNNAHLAIDRLVELGIARGVLTEACLAVTAQRLPRKICPNCREGVYISEREELLERFKEDPVVKKQMLKYGDFSFYEANSEGCIKCSGGYKGIRSAVEFLPINSYMDEEIRAGRSATKIRSEQMEKGTFFDLWSDGLRLIEEGVCDFKSVTAALGSYEAARNRESN